MSPETAWFLLVPVAWLSMWLVEHRWPARQYVPVRGWKWRGVAFFMLTAVVSSLIAAALKAAHLGTHPVLQLSSLGYWGIPVGLLATSFVTYWWHRASHRFDVLWRFSHQLHHSARRIDIPGAFFAHPVEVAVKGTLAFVVASVVLGLSHEAAAAVGACSALISISLHWNVRTPHVLGVFMQRPEMHCLHHEYGEHRRNYGDLPIWDLLFGTFENPRSEDVAGIRFGFDDERSARIADMLLMRDVNREPAPPLTVG